MAARPVSLSDAHQYPSPATEGGGSGFAGHVTILGLPMPRYFIDTNDDDRFVEDEEGHILADAEAAREMAQASLPDMAREKLPDGDGRTFSAVVRDEAGTVIYKATLKLTGEWSTGQKPS